MGDILRAFLYITHLFFVFFCLACFVEVQKKKRFSQQKKSCSTVLHYFAKEKKVLCIVEFILGCLH